MNVGSSYAGMRLWGDISEADIAYINISLETPTRMRNIRSEEEMLQIKMKNT